MKLAALLLTFLTLPLRAQSGAAATPYVPTRFTVTSTGAGPDVLFLPGLASSREVFSSEAKLLAPNYRLHMLQINGFAGAPAGANVSGPIFKPIVEEIHAYIIASKIHPAVVGHSLGGLLTLMLADAHPEDVSKILIIDTLPFYGLTFDPAATVDSMRAQAQVIRDQILAAPDDQFAAMQPAMIPRLVHDPAGIAAVSAASIASNRTVFANAMYEDLTTDITPRIAFIKTPATLLYPYDPTTQGPDPSAVEALYTKAYATMPNLSLKRIDNSRHFIMYDQPDALHAAILTFFR